MESLDACCTQTSCHGFEAESGCGGSYLSNCYIKPSEGKDGVSLRPDEWERCWETTLQSVKKAEVSFP